MKNKAAKIISVFLIAAVFACLAISAFAANKENNETVSTVSANTAEVEQSKPEKTGTEQGGTDNSAFKDETVYVLANADGTVQKIIVSDWIKNTSLKDQIEDVTELVNTENIKGDYEYTLGGDNTRVWDAQGNDIYYQGTIEKVLPVDLTVTYKLDGKAISPVELAGKSGRVTIRYEYRNNQYEIANIDGKEEKIYVPFAMLTGMLLDNNTFTNVEVTNGKIVNDGDRTAVIGLALPGLQENLGIDREKLEIPSYVEITADVTDFSLGTTITMATNAPFSGIDTGKLDSITDLTDSMNELNDAMTELLDGSSALYDGLCTLLDKSSDLISGIDQLADGAAKLKGGAYSLNGGAKRLYDGTSALAGGLDTLAANNDKLNGGAKKVFEALLSTAETQLKAARLEVPALTVDNYAAVLNSVIDSLDDTRVYNQALAQVTAAVEAKRDFIRSQVAAAVRTEVEDGITGAVKEQVKAQVTKAVKEQVSEQVKQAVRSNIEAQVIQAVTGMDKSGYDNAVSAGLVDAATQNAINTAVNEKMTGTEAASAISSAIESQMQSETVAETITQKVNEQMNTAQTKAIIETNTDAKMAENDIQSLINQNTELQIQKAISEAMAGEEVQSKLSAASEGAKTVISLKSSLDDFNAFYLGLMDYTAGVREAAAGASELKNGAKELQNGANTLYTGICTFYDGILTMKNGAPALADGISRLKDGSMQLTEGLAQFNEKGIQRLMETADDASTFMDRLKATVNASRNYRSFAGIDSNTDGNVKFVFKTDEIKTDK